MAEGLSLVSNKSISHSRRFSCGIGSFTGVELMLNGKYRQVHTALPCNTWNCEYCRKKKAKKFAKRAMMGCIGLYEGTNGFRSRYEAKMFTFTCPGADYRKYLPDNPFTHDYTGDHDPETVYRIMAKEFDKLIRAMRKKYGNFMYLRCVEPQRDGYPHFHVLFVGEKIKPKAIYDHVKNLWESKYGQGFAWVSGIKNKAGKRVPFRSVKHAVNYCLKYLKKAPGKFSQMNRPLTSCKNALVPPPPKKVWLGYTFQRGACEDFGFNVAELEFNSPFALEEYLFKQDLMVKYRLVATRIDEDTGKIKKRRVMDEFNPSFTSPPNGYQECIDFFDSIIEENRQKGYHVQLRLF